jgi:hypothetical protein
LKIHWTLSNPPPPPSPGTHDNLLYIREGLDINARRTTGQTTITGP